VRQRRSPWAERPHALWRRQGLGPWLGRDSLVDRGHDRAAPAGLRPAAVGRVTEPLSEAPAAPVRPMRWARLLHRDELRDGELIPVEIDGTPVVVVRHAGEFFAVQNNCTHQDFPLSEAGFDPPDQPLTCAWHGGGLSNLTGAAVTPPATEPVETFPIRISPDGWVEI